MAGKNKNTSHRGSNARRFVAMCKAALVAAPLLLSSVSVSAYPDNAGSLCTVKDMTDMTSSTHGAASSGSGGFSLTATADSATPGTYQITLAGGSYKGLLLYASDAEGFIGNFADFPDTISTKDDCGNSESSVLQHNSKDSKSGFTATWQTDSFPADNTQIEIHAVVLTALKTWYVVPAATFSYIGPAASSNATETLPLATETANPDAVDPTATAGPDATMTLADATMTLDATATADSTATLTLGDATITLTPTATMEDSTTTTSKAAQTGVPDNLKPLAGIAVKITPTKRDYHQEEGLKAWLRRRWFA